MLDKIHLKLRMNSSISNGIMTFNEMHKVTSGIIWYQFGSTIIYLIIIKVICSNMSICRSSSTIILCNIIHAIIMSLSVSKVVRLNLFNQVLALFRAKFACILTIRYPVFRWELCKSCVWESVKKSQDVCIQRSLATGSYDWLAISKSPKWHTCEACRELKGHDS